MAQQNLTLRIDVSAQDAAEKVGQITKAFKDLGISFTTADVKVRELGQSMAKVATPAQAGIKTEQRLPTSLACAPPDRFFQAESRAKSNGRREADVYDVNKVFLKIG